MPNDIIIPKNFGQVLVPYDPEADDLGAGIVGGFAVVKYKGKVWAIAHRGENHQVLDENNNPLYSIDVVILKSARVLSKLYYAGGWKEDASEGVRPDCWSSNSVAPDVSVPQPQSPICAVCPMNAFGSGSNGKGKACSDNKRLAVVPMDDIPNEYYGGPMMLRVPPDSLTDLSAYSAKLKELGWNYAAIATRITFDRQESHPKFLFQPVRALTADEIATVEQLRDDPRTARILETALEQPAVATPESQPQAQIQPRPAATTPNPGPRPMPRQPTVATAPVAQPQTKQTNTVKNTPPPAQATTPPAASPRPFGGAPRPGAGPSTVAPTPQARPAVGGFAKRPAPAPAQTISQAVAQPAARPPTQRAVVQEEQPEEEVQEEQPEDENQAQGQIPDELLSQLDGMLQ